MARKFDAKRRISGGRIHFARGFKSLREPIQPRLDGADGGLMVGAALKPADFVQIINAANQE
jgi:hypothetical protein